MAKQFLINNHEYFIKHDNNIKINNDSEICQNWWPVSTGVILETSENIPHPLCKVCANWLPDIEDIVKSSKCINKYPNSS
jgi:hypothetical protein